MIALLARKVVHSVPVLVAVSLLTFLLMYLSPSPLAQLMQEGGLTAEQAQQVADERGWNDPWHQQYARWVTGLFQGDWGTSTTGEPARNLIMERLPTTLALSGTALALALLLALPLGTWMALRRNGRADMLSTLLAVGVMAMPSFLLAFLLQLLAVGLRDASGGIVLYTGGAPIGDSWIELVQRYTLPVLTLTGVQLAAWMRFQRAETARVLQEDYVVAARARGLSERMVLVRHVFRNAALPLVALLALDVATLIGGSVIVETIFAVPGTGRLLVDAVQSRDAVVALDIVALGAVVMVFCNALADLVSSLLDPRQRAER